MTHPVEPNLPPTRPRQFMGQPIDGLVPEGQGALPQGFWTAARKSAAFEWEIAAERWKSVFEKPDNAVTAEEFQELVGEREIPFTPDITTSEVERRIAFHDYDQAQQRFQGRPIAELFGGMGPALLDPVNVLTLPAGGASFARAAVAKTTGAFVKHMALGGTVAGIASAPLEIAFQQDEGDELNLPRLAGAVIGPVVAAPALGLAGRAISRSFRRITDGANANAHVRSATTPDHVDPADATRIIGRADADAIAPPPITVREAPTWVPQARLRDTFKDYKGGHKQWVRDLAAGRTAARVKAEALGLDPDDEAFGRLIAAASRQSDVRSATPTEYNLKVLDTFNLFRAGEVLDDAQRQLLAENGLALPAARLGVEGVEDTGELAVSSVGRRVAEALDDPKAPANNRLLNNINRSGLAAARNDLRAAADMEPDDFDALPRIIDDQIDDRIVLQHLEAAGLRRPDPGPMQNVQAPAQRAEPRPDPEAGNVTYSAEIQDMRAAAREAGADPDEVAAAMKELGERVTRCG